MNVIKAKAVKIAMQVGIPIVVEAIVDMLGNTDLPEYRDKAINGLRKLADKSNTNIDDMAVEAIAPLLLDFDNLVVAIEYVFPIVKKYVASTSTNFDDKLILPILDAVEAMVNIEDE